jgi:alpha-tubulin suppressor-like RCC1 family protein
MTTPRLLTAALLAALLILTASGCTQDLDIDSATFACSLANPTTCGDGYRCVPTPADPNRGVCISNAAPLDTFSPDTDTDATTDPDTLTASDTDATGTDATDATDTTDTTPACNNCPTGRMCNTSGQCVPAIIAIAAGLNHNCLLRNNGEVSCWGANNAGQADPFATVSGGDISPPVKVTLPTNALLPTGTDQTLCAGDNHSCVIISGTDERGEIIKGGVFCWGANDNKQLGTDTSVNGNTYLIPDITEAVSLTCGAQHTCALTTQSDLWCWGSNASGQLGIGRADQTALPTPVTINGTPFTTQRIAAGDQHTCAIGPGNTMYCWGSNVNGALATEDTNDAVFAPSPVTGMTQDDLRAVTAGGGHTCAVVGVSNSVLATCWGRNEKGQTGTGNTMSPASPKRVLTNPTTNLDSVSSLHAGAEHTCALKGDDGAVWCWGNELNGRIGRAPTGSDAVFAQRPELSLGSPVQPGGLALGGAHTCALLANSEVFCWGSNSSQQLGTITPNESAKAQRVPGTP